MSECSKSINSNVSSPSSNVSQASSPINLDDLFGATNYSLPSPPKNKPPFYPVKKIKKEKKILTSNPNVKIIKIEADAEVTVSRRAKRICLYDFRGF